MRDFTIKNLKVFFNNCKEVMYNLDNAILLSISILFLLIAVYVFMRSMFYQNNIDSNNMRAMSAIVLSFAVAIFSIYNSNRVLCQSEKLSMIQSRAFLYIDGMQFRQEKDVLEKENKKNFVITVVLKNSGNLPAIDIGIKGDILYFTRGEKTYASNRISFVENKADNVGVMDEMFDNIKHGLMGVSPISKGCIVAPGEMTRVREIEIIVTEEEAKHLIADKSKVSFVISIKYKSPGYNQVWIYKAFLAPRNNKYVIINEEIG